MVPQLAGDVELNSGPDKHCIAKCKHNGSDSGNMIRCCLCASWFHEEFVGLTSSSDQGFWPCPECRQTGSRVQNLTLAVENLTTITTNLVEQVKEMKRTQEKENEELQTAKTALQTENTSLKESIATLNTKLPEMKWQSFRGPNQKKSVLVGDGSIKHVSHQNLKDTEVICEDNGLLQSIGDRLRRLNCGYDSMDIVAGSADNRRAISTSKPAADIVESYRVIVDIAKDKARNVTISSIPPLLDLTDSENKVASVNAGLLQLCQESKITFAGNTSMFTLGDGSTNDGYFEQDGYHITPTATNKLIKRLGVKLRDDNCNPCDATAQRHQESQGRRQDTPTQPYPNRRSDVRCFYCGETGHVKNSCHHGQKVQCHTCKSFGHKAKFCTAT